MFQPGSHAGQHGLLHFQIKLRSVAGTILTRFCVSMLLLLISALGHTEMVHQDLPCPGVVTGLGTNLPITEAPETFQSNALKPFLLFQSKEIWQQVEPAATPRKWRLSLSTTIFTLFQGCFSCTPSTPAATCSFISLSIILCDSVLHRQCNFSAPWSFYST